MSTETHTPNGLRSSLANAAWAVEERVVWGAGDTLRSGTDVAKWPFERIAWALERWLIWPLQERAGGLDGPLRAAGLALLAVAAIGAGVAGLLWAAPDSGSQAPVAQTPPPSRLPIARRPAKAPAPAHPVLHGAAPVFAPQVKSTVGDISQTAPTAAKANAGSAEATADTATGSTGNEGGAAAVEGPPAGPAAIKIAHQFADAFVLYETGAGGSQVRGDFLETATPQLAHTLLKRPPRLPANVKVPKAKVLNVVAGPSHGGIYAVSVSLLRVGLTSELRLDMQQIKHRWRVARVLG